MTYESAVFNEIRFNKLRRKASRLEGELFFAQQQGLPHEQIAERLDATYMVIDSFNFVPTAQDKDQFNHCI